MIGAAAQGRRVTLGADKAYDAAEHVAPATGHGRDTARGGAMPLLRDVMATLGIDFERHGNHPGQ